MKKILLALLILVFCAMAGRAHSQNANRLIAISPDQYGAFGDGIQSISGVTNNTTTFTDANGTFNSFDVGKQIFIVPPQQTGDATFAGTISAVGSATSITLSGNPGWSATALQYYYGHDDSAAFTAANSAVWGQVTRTGVSTGYGNYDSIQCLNLQDGRIYLTKQTSIIAAGNGTAPCWRASAGGKAIVATGGLGGTTDCITFGNINNATLSGTHGAHIEGIHFDCTMSGRDGLTWYGFQNPQIDRVDVYNAFRDCMVIEPAGDQFIQQGHVESLNMSVCGRHGLNINVTAPAFANEIDFENLVIGSVSANSAGGTEFFLTSAGTGGVDSWNIKNWKFTQAWGGNASYQPLAYCIGTAASVNAWNLAGLTFTDGYCENGGTALGATNAPIFAPNTSQIGWHFYGFWAFQWGLDITRAPFDAMGSWTITHGVAKDIWVTTAFGGWSGICNIAYNDGTNFQNSKVSVVAINSTAPVITSLGLVSSPGAPTYTLTGTTAATLDHLTVTNTASVASLTVTFACKDDYRTGIPLYNYQ